MDRKSSTESLAERQAKQRALSKAVLAHIDQQTGYKTPIRRWLTRWEFVTAATLIALVAYIFSLFYPSPITEGILKGSTAVAAAATFVFTYLQWSLARHEASFEKFYDRSIKTIDYINAYGLEEAESKDAKIDHLRNIRTFMQLDSIEYILGKYRLRFLEDDLVDRAFGTFITECNNEWFRSKARHWYVVVRGYHADTCAAAEFMIRHREQEIAAGK